MGRELSRGCGGGNAIENWEEAMDTRPNHGDDAQFSPTSAEAQLERSALEYHRYPTPGKISVGPTKGMSNQRDLALA